MDNYLNSKYDVNNFINKKKPQLFYSLRKQFEEILKMDNQNDVIESALDLKEKCYSILSSKKSKESEKYSADLALMILEQFLFNNNIELISFEDIRR